jgi:hypothetical protein
MQFQPWVFINKDLHYELFSYVWSDEHERWPFQDRISEKHSASADNESMDMHKDLADRSGQITKASCRCYPIAAKNLWMQACDDIRASFLTQSKSKNISPFCTIQ